MWQQVSRLRLWPVSDILCHFVVPILADAGCLLIDREGFTLQGQREEYLFTGHVPQQKGLSRMRSMVPGSKHWISKASDRIHADAVVAEDFRC